MRCTLDLYSLILFVSSVAWQPYGSPRIKAGPIEKMPLSVSTATNDPAFDYSGKDKYVKTNMSRQTERLRKSVHTF